MIWILFQRYVNGSEYPVSIQEIILKEFELKLEASLDRYSPVIRVLYYHHVVARRDPVGMISYTLKIQRRW